MRFETRYTYDFVKRFLPSGCRRILEIGCGTGDLAAHLSKDGFSVVAIDSDRDSVSAARELGADARIATWPDFEEGRFDALLFTRSLHHIHPLDKSIEHATHSLADHGCIIVEDFAYESVDEKTLRWFRGATRVLEATGSLAMDRDFLKMVLLKTAALKAWVENHQKELHTAAEISAELEGTSGYVVKENAAYYFRYLATAIATTGNRNAILQNLAEQKENLARQESILALGRRFVTTVSG